MMVLGAYRVEGFGLRALKFRYRGYGLRALGI